MPFYHLLSMHLSFELMYIFNQIQYLVGVFREFRCVKISREIFEIVIKNVHSFIIEILSDFFVLVEHISKIGFFEIRVKSLVSDSSVGEQERESGHDLESCCEISELVEK